MARTLDNAKTRNSDIASSAYKSVAYTLLMGFFAALHLFRSFFLGVRSLLNRLWLACLVCRSLSLRFCWQCCFDIPPFVLAGPLFLLLTTFGDCYEGAFLETITMLFTPFVVAVLAGLTTALPSTPRLMPRQLQYHDVAKRQNEAAAELGLGDPDILQLYV